MAGEQVLYVAAIVLGIAGGALAQRLAPSERNALVLGLIPLFGFALGTTFC